MRNLWQAVTLPVGHCIDYQENGRDCLLKVYAVGAWGQNLRDIALHPDLSDLAKNRQTAELCWVILSTVRFGPPKDPLPWSREDAELWQDAQACPACCSKSKVPSVTSGGLCLGRGKQPYPRVILAKQVWQRNSKGSYQVPICLSLHRFACWLAEGNPSADVCLATHLCGKKQCLRLACLRWGNHKTNQEDVEELAEALGKLRVKGRQPKG